MLGKQKQRRRASAGGCRRSTEGPPSPEPQSLGAPEPPPAVPCPCHQPLGTRWWCPFWAGQGPGMRMSVAAMEKRKINPSGPWAAWGSTAGAVQGEQTPSDTCSQDTTAGPQPSHAPSLPQTLFSPGRGQPRVPAPSGVRAGPWGRGEGKNQKKIAAVNGAEPRRPRRLQRDFDSPIITPN